MITAGWGDAGFEPGTAGFTVWCTTIKPPHPPKSLAYLEPEFCADKISCLP